MRVEDRHRDTYEPEDDIDLDYPDRRELAVDCSIVVPAPRTGDPF